MAEVFVGIDENGHFIDKDDILKDEATKAKALVSLIRDDRGRYLAHVQNTTIWVEAFDEPLVALQVVKSKEGELTLRFPYGYSSSLLLDRLSLDEWDRFHGYTDNGISYVLSRKAQEDFFSLLDEFDDDSITFEGRRVLVPSWFIDNPQIQQKDFWNQRYQGQDTPWDLGRVNPILEQSLQQLKLPRQRILVLGCGTGADAAYLAQIGHIVTAIDKSGLALEAANKKYGQVKNLEFLQADLFHLPQDFHHAFDLVFEHTCYCAISPFLRNDLVKIWSQVLVEGGHLLAILFTMDRREGPPFGGSEWEIRQRLRKSFEFLYWTRWRNSIETRQASELFVYAQKKSSL